MSIHRQPSTGYAGIKKVKNKNIQLPEKRQHYQEVRSIISLQINSKKAKVYNLRIKCNWW